MTAVGTGLFWMLCFGASAWMLWGLYKRAVAKFAYAMKEVSPGDVAQLSKPPGAPAAQLWCSFSPVLLLLVSPCSLLSNILTARKVAGIKTSTRIPSSNSLGRERDAPSSPRCSTFTPCPVPSCPAYEPNSHSVLPSLSTKAYSSRGAGIVMQSTEPRDFASRLVHTRPRGTYRPDLTIRAVPHNYPASSFATHRYRRSLRWRRRTSPVPG